LISVSTQRDVLKQEAIRLGYADYNSTNGNWEWKTNNFQK